MKGSVRLLELKNDTKCKLHVLWVTLRLGLFSFWEYPERIVGGDYNANF